ncbi:BrnT family toxin [Aurantimonas aggregata]|uniref:BrnT family toxin n=1 Tax=Aurantimonas aggregata TaxID=2047720 RepID=A0A6L9ML15_9HYPH|nr:BrnT family toxin [Aurantimonas aggregata]NDV88316.1 BrnT family toxin [Aurantimonas aggregata]
MEFDAAKDAENVAKHGISLARTAELDLRVVVEDDRYDYGEVRYRGFGLIDGQPYCVAFTVRGGSVRPISLRRAHRKEFERYVGR